MNNVLLRELFRNTEKYGDAEVTVQGWIRNNRNSNKFGFIELNDGSFFKSVQVVYEDEFLGNYEEIAKAYVGSALEVTGIVSLTPNAKQPFEIKARKIASDSECSHELARVFVPERKYISKSTRNFTRRGQ